METKYLLFIVALVVSLLGFSLSNIKFSNKIIKLNSDNDYKTDWQKVDSLENQGLPKSALEIVEAIYIDAKKHNNTNQIIKSFIYKMKFNNATEENAFEKSIYDLQNEIKNTKFPQKNIMQSMLAEMYWMYYQNNRWNFSNRTQTTNFENTDIQTWDLNTLSNQVIKNYKASLENSDSLKTSSLKRFEVLINKGENTLNLRPTLYDFLAQRAISFFENKEITLSKPADFFQLKEDFYFLPASEFANYKIETSDTMSLQFYGIDVLQDLLKFRYPNKNIEAYIDVDLQRLNFVYRNSVNENKDKLYENALINLLKTYNNLEFSSNISYFLGVFYKNMGSKLNANDTSTYIYKDFNTKAYNIFSKAVELYPNTIAGKKCDYEIKLLKNRTLMVNTEQVLIPNKAFSTLVTYKNIDTLYTKILKINFNDYKEIISSYYGKDQIDKLIRKSEKINENNFVVPVDADFNTHSTELLFNGLNNGLYMLFISDNSKFNYNDNYLTYNVFSVSNISYISSENNQQTEIYVLNRNSGNPMANVKADVFAQKYDYKQRKYIKNKVATKFSNQNGFLSIEPTDKQGETTFFIELSTENDFLSSETSFYANNYRYTETPHIVNTIFTDRAIYRPGQKVYFKGISIKYDGDSRTIVTNNKESVIFYDANYQKISSLNLTTNEFGTFNGTFDIPTGILNGQMQIQTSNGSVYFRVEEYKRPKFETEFLPFNGSYKLNDFVEVQGKAISYSGATLSDATVKYRVVRTPIWRYWWWHNTYSPNIEIENGTVTTNEKGIYSIKFKAIPDLAFKKSDNVNFNYTIYADVTDINGETQSTSKSITIGYVDLNLSTNIPESLQKENTDTFKLYTNNLNGEKINAKGELKIYKLKTPEKYLQKRLWQQPDKFIYSEKEWNTKFAGNIYKETPIFNYEIEKQVFAINFNSEKNDNILLETLKSWETGFYKLLITSTDAFGNSVENMQFITIISDESTKMPFPEIFWIKPLKINCEVGETAKILIGSSENVKILYEIEQKGNNIKSAFIEINNNQKILEIPITEDYRGNITANFNYVYNNRYYTFSQTIIVPHTNKQLDISFKTFRNKLYPGEKEKWQLTIKGKKGESVMAEMMATLYDQSLDQFATNNWHLNIWRTYYANKYWQGGEFGTTNSRLFYFNSKASNNYLYQSYDEFNWFGFNYYTNRYTRVSKGMANFSRAKSVENLEGGYEVETSVMAKEEAMSDQSAALPAPSTGQLLDGIKNDTAKKLSEQEEQQMSGESSGKGLSNIKARTNFNETAFFYPELRTNETGDLVIEFTIPESLTKWKMMGLATTKDLKIGYIQNELITQKDLMVVPNPPRFFREGDKIEFPVKISNISDKNLLVDYNIEFFDAFSEKSIFITDFKSQQLNISAGENKFVSATITIPDNVDAIKYRVVAKSGKFTDAEENAIPVLKNRMLVTESLPLPIRGNQTKTFTFEKLKNNTSETLKNYKYTLEFTSNPAWYAVQALPYLMEYPYECAEQTFSRFYSNSIASHIANSSPKIQAVFNSWKNTPKSEALLSNLEKNQELKALMLQETPWVLEGKNESERKARIGVLFDLNKMSNELTTALKKLIEMQSSNGGWPWFKGMPENRYITQYIVSGLGHLQHLNISTIKANNEAWKMTIDAIKYLDDRITDDYNYLKKHYTEKEMKLAHIGSTQIQYLYARSFFSDIKINNNNKDAYNYYFGQAKQYWINQDKYSQGMIALTLKRSPEAKTGVPIEQKIVQSLKEFSTSNEEMGMYWKDNTAGYYWYQAPIETQALMIEVFDEVANDTKSVEDLKIWLLKQKQTQNWQTTKASAEAIYALLLKGTNLLASDKLVEITIGKTLIDPKKIDGVNVEAGTGYFKTSWSGNDINSNMGEITVSKKDDGIAWGAVYWQYFEQLDKITKHKTPLYIEKKLFVEKLTPSGKIIEPIEKNKIKIGDKIIVRIELRVDRDMEYVHMKDMRASGFEPINVISRYKYQDGLGYYETTKDASTNFFIDYLSKGTYVFEYPLRVSHKGDFSNGITTIQCMYAPEFTSHSEGVRVKVE